MQVSLHCCAKKTVRQTSAPPMALAHLSFVGRSPAPFRGGDQAHVLFVGETGGRRCNVRRRILMRAIDRISFGAQVREHLMTSAGGPLVPERRDVNWREHDALAGARRRLR